jgi:hypothetical protein
MKRVRRISVSVEHREVLVSIAQTVEASGEPRPPLVPEDFAEAEACPACGEPWITVAAQAGTGGAAGAIEISRTFQPSGVHMQVSPTGELRMCSKLWEKIRNQQAKESSQ